MLIGFVQGYEELKWRISKLNPLCNGPMALIQYCLSISSALGYLKIIKERQYHSFINNYGAFFQ